MRLKSTKIIDDLKSTVEAVQEEMGWDLSDLRTLLGKKSIELEQMRMDALEVKRTVPPADSPVRRLARPNSEAVTVTS